MSVLVDVGSANARVAQSLFYIAVGYALKHINVLQRRDGEGLLCVPIVSWVHRNGLLVFALNTDNSIRRLYARITLVYFM